MEASQILAWLIGSSTVIGTMAWGIVAWRRGISTVDKENITSQAALLATYKQEIDALKANQVEHDRQIVILQTEMVEIKRTNSDLQKIITEALQAYFEEHPEAAIEAAKAIRK